MIAGERGMTTAVELIPPTAGKVDLNNGDRLTQKEFHRLYEQTDPGFKAELIGGIVYVASPLRIRHGTNHLPIGSLFLTYEASTPGVQCCDNTTVILGENAEPQPDLLLRILPEFGGQSRTNDDDYIEGAPELIAEIALSSRAIDLHAKRDDYSRFGVLEYLVVNLRDNRLHWFDLRGGRELSPDADGVCRIHTFPGLWVNAPAVLSRDFGQMTATLNAGLSTPEHTAFVQQLAAARAARPG
jgi:Uma2 family endonuclease